MRWFDKQLIAYLLVCRVFLRWQWWSTRKFAMRWFCSGRGESWAEVRLRLVRDDVARVFELPHRVEPSAGFFGEVKSLLGPRALTEGRRDRASG